MCCMFSCHVKTQYWLNKYIVHFFKPKRISYQINMYLLIKTFKVKVESPYSHFTEQTITIMGKSYVGTS